MADVQLEKGYTRIANEILEAIAQIKLSPTAFRLIILVWRYTYGFGRKDAELSLSFLANATSCDKRQIQRELKRLQDQKIIFQKTVSGVNRTISFNKDFASWIGETAVGNLTVGETDNGGTINATIGEIVKGTIGEITNQERKHIKKTIKKDIIGKNEKTKNHFEDFSNGNFDLLIALTAFEEMRNKIKRPLTDRAKELITSKLEKLSKKKNDKTGYMVACLNQSTESCWQGVFDLKEPFEDSEPEPALHEAPPDWAYDPNKSFLEQLGVDFG